MSKNSGIYGNIRQNITLYLQKYIELNQQGLDDSESARTLQVSYTTTRAWRLKLGLKKNFKYKRTFDVKKFDELYNQGYNYSEIARRLGISDSTAQEFGAQQGYKARPKHYKDRPLTSIEFQILLGTILGDAYLGIDKSEVSAFCSFNHSMSQYNYCLWKYEALKRLFSRGPKLLNLYDKRTKKTYYQVSVKSHSSPILGAIYSQFYYNKVKYINEDTLAKIEPLGLAVWFMDDGYKHANSYSLATNCFTDSDIELIKKVLLSKFDLQFTKLKGNILHLAAKDREKFTQLVLPYIHKDCIYKLHGIH